MERVFTLLDKIKELNTKPNPTIIEVDLMLDYTRVLYADLYEWRKKIAFNDAVTLNNAGIRTDDVEKIKSQFPPLSNSTPPAQENKITHDIGQPQEKHVISFRASSQSQADVRPRIGINDKYQFISELFHNNKDAYEEVINELSSFETEEEAINWINNTVGNQFHWNDEMESVQNFYKMLKDFFTNR